MQKIARLLRCFRKGNSLKISVKILKIIAKSHLVFVWNVCDECNEHYYTQVSSTAGENFLIRLRLTEPKSGYKRYEFNVEEASAGMLVGIGFLIFTEELGRFSEVRQLRIGRSLSLSVGYLIQELYNKVHNHFQVIVKIDDLKNQLENLRDSLKELQKV